MNRKVGLWIAVAAVAVVLGGYVLMGRSHIPAPASGGQARKPAVDTAEAQVRTVMARLAAQSQLAASARDPNRTAPVAAQPAPDEQQELRDIDAYAAAERQKIETWYAEQVAGLRAQLEQRVQTLNEKDKLAWAQFFERAKETWSNPRGPSATATPDPAGEYTAILARIKDPRQMTQQDFVNAQIGLARMRQDKLAAVQMEVDRRRALLALQKPPAPPTPTKEPQKQQKPTIDPPPKVEAVMAGADNRLCALIGERFVSEGATVQGYRVKKIQADSVEFEKDGQTCVQKVN